MIPIRTSHTPVTRVSTTIESHGQTSTTTPAITDKTPRTTYQPRAGSSLQLIATATTETPWTIKLAPIHIDSSRMGYGSPKLRKHKSARITDSTPLMNSRTRMPADSGKVKAIATPANPDNNK